MDKKKSYLFIHAFFLLLIERMIYVIPIMFYPLQAEKRNISPSYIGLTLSFLAIGNIIVSSILGATMKNLNRKNILLFGLIILIFTTFSYGMGDFIKNGKKFLIFNIIIRFFQGWYSGIAYTVGFSFVYDFFHIEIDRKKKISFFWVATALGNVSGSGLGSLFFYFFSYQGLFIVISCILAIYCISFVITFPNPVLLLKLVKSNSNNDQLINNEKEISTQKHSIEYFKFFFNFKVLLSLSNSFIGNISSSVFLTGYSIFLKHTFQLSNSLISLLYAFALLFRMLSNFLYPKYKLKNTVYVTVLGNVIMSFGLFLFGLKEFNISNQLCVPIIGLIIVNLGTSFYMNPFISIFNHFYREIDSDIDKEVLNHFISSLNSVMVSSSDLLAPIIGGVLMDYLTYSLSMIYYSIGLLIFQAFFILCALIWDTKKRKIEKSLLANPV